MWKIINSGVQCSFALRNFYPGAITIYKFPVAVPLVRRRRIAVIIYRMFQKRKREEHMYFPVGTAKLVPGKHVYTTDKHYKTSDISVPRRLHTYKCKLGDFTEHESEISISRTICLHSEVYLTGHLKYNNSGLTKYFLLNRKRFYSLNSSW